MNTKQFFNYGNGNGVLKLLAIPIFLFLLLIPFISAQGLVNPGTSVSFYTGNLTNLSEMQDVTLLNPTNLQLFQFQTGDNKWHSYSFVLGDWWDYDYADLINEPTVLSNFTNDLGYYNSTTLTTNSQLANGNAY